MKWLLCELLFTCAIATPAMPLDELTYRTVLFDYYTDAYDDAMVKTLVAAAQGRTGEDAARFDLARGSFAFKDGMYTYARDTFDAVAPEELQPIDRARLAFHLARVHHQRGDWSQLAGALARFDVEAAQLEGAIDHPEVPFMRLDLALAGQDLAAAQHELATLDDMEPLKAYGLYNLAVLQRDLGRMDEARSTFAALAELPATADDSFDLVQRAKLALAYMARDDGAATDAETLLAALPGSGRYRDVAMAAYGNLSMRGEDPELAARIWLTLQQNGDWTASATAARLGLPMSLSAIAQPETVLAHYRSAETQYMSRQAVLVGLLGRTEEPSWVRTLAAVFAAGQEDEDTLAALLENWEQDIGHREWVGWLAGEQSHQLLDQWRELDRMKQYLSALPDQLDGFAAVASEQQRRAGAARQLLEGDGLLARRAHLEAQISGLASRLDVLDGSDRNRAWYAALANPDDLELLQELWALRDRVEAIMEADARTRWLARADRLLGLQYYTLANNLAARRWQLTRSVQALEAQLLEVDAKIARVEAAEENFVTGVATDFDSYAARAHAMIAKVDVALGSREEALAGLLRQRIRGESERIDQYLFATRVAIARATDQLAMGAALEDGS